MLTGQLSLILGNINRHGNITRELVRVVSLKINSNVYPLKNANSHYLLLDITIIPLHNGKIPRIFFCEGYYIKKKCKGKILFVRVFEIIKIIQMYTDVSFKPTPIIKFRSVLPNRAQTKQISS